MLTHTHFRSFLTRCSLLLLGLGVVSINSLPTLASTEEVSPASVSTSETVHLAEATTPTLSDGVYLYGQSPKPEQIGQEYLVFKITRGRVIGAFYLPQSEFSCFYGTINSRQMNLSVVGPYDNSVSAYAIALDKVSPVASTGKPIVGLQGYHAITTVSENDQRMLHVCLQRHR